MVLEIGVSHGIHIPSRYEDYENAVYYGEEEAPMDDDEATYEAYAVMIEQGLDEDNAEALEYAAEIIQAESESVLCEEQGAPEWTLWLWWRSSISSTRTPDFGRPEFRP